MKSRFLPVPIILLFNISCLFPGKFSVNEGPIDRSDLPLKISHIRGSIYLVQDFNYWNTNSVFFAGKEGIVFFDAGWTEKSARQVIWKAATKSSADYIGVVITSYPLYRTGGLSAFKQMGIKIYTHEKTPQLISKRWFKMQWEMKRSFNTWRYTAPVRPDGTFEKELSILGGKIRVYYPGPGYTIDNQLVYFPQEKVLYAGSLLFPPLIFHKKVNHEQYAKALKALKKFDFSLLILGHGEPILEDVSISHLQKIFKDRLHGYGKY